MRHHFEAERIANIADVEHAVGAREESKRKTARGRRHSSVIAGAVRALVERMQADQDEKQVERLAVNSREEDARRAKAEDEERNKRLVQ